MNENEIWKPVTRFGRVVPGYEVSNKGRVRNGAGILKQRTLYRNVSNSHKRSEGRTVDLVFSNELFSDIYRYNKRYRTSNKTSAIVKVHRLVIEAFKPLELNPPEPMTVEDWNLCPDSVKQVLNESCYVDHIDDNPENNNIENLRWVTVTQNHRYRKHSKDKTKILSVPVSVYTFADGSPMVKNNITQTLEELLNG